MNITGPVYDMLSGSWSTTLHDHLLLLWRPWRRRGSHQCAPTSALRWLTAERAIYEPLPEALIQLRDREVDSPELAGFEGWLRRHPILRARAARSISVGGSAHSPRRGEIFVVRFNLLLTPSEQPLGAFEGSGSDMVARWALSVLDHYALPYDPKAQYWKRSRDEILALYRPDDEPIDWHAVAERLRSTGRPVPDDLFDQPTR
ncbi:MAG: hypothetical protein R3F65_11925 [bacterium]